MLETLSIKNIAIIDSAEIAFSEGLNVLSGETGAGKSIVIEAISLLLGSRAHTELVRAGCEEAVIEGLFNISAIPWMGPRLEKLGFNSTSSELLIKRTVHKAGRHRIYINGELATLAILQELCDGLIDLCSQNEHQSLIKPPKQLELLDRYGSLQEQDRAMGEVFRKVEQLRAELGALRDSENERARRADFLKFQLEELRNAALEPGEDLQLQLEKQLLQSAEARIQAAEGARRLLEAQDAGEEGALSALRASMNRLRTLTQLDDRAISLQEGLERALAETEEVCLALHRYLGAIDLNTERLESVQERLSLLADLKRKYGSSIEEMLATLERLEKEHASIQYSEQHLSELEHRIAEVTKEMTKLAAKLTSARQKFSALLSDSVTHELKDLNMKEARFGVELTQRSEIEEWTAHGADTIQFVVRTNRGEPERPLGKIASGGELSRLMLAIRRVISDKGGIGVYLFDEIDAGIGGQTAFQVGKKLKSVAAFNQVICITHLPQVASFADHHLVVKKAVSGKRTTTEVVQLNKAERKNELARMLGGPELTRRSLENAAELLELAKASAQ